MLPQTQPRKKRNSSKVNLIISFIFHALLVLVVLYFAARQGLLGKQLQKISVEMVKEKPPEKPKEPEKPKVEPPKVETPKAVEPPKVVEEAKAAPPPAIAPPTVAPPAAELPSFEFDGGKAVETSSRPGAALQGLRWNTPCARNGTGRTTWTMTIMWPRWKCRWTGTGRSATRSGRKVPATPRGTIRCGGHRRGDRPWTARRRRIFRRASPSASTCRRKPNPCCNEPEKDIPFAITVR